MSHLFAIWVFIVAVLVAAAVVCGPVGYGLGWVLDRTTGAVRVAAVAGMVFVAVPGAVILLMLAGTWLGTTLGLPQ